MARKKGTWRRAGLSAADKEAAAERIRRKASGMRKAARMLSTQELADVVEEQQTLEGIEDLSTEEGEGSFDTPEPEQVMKLCALASGNGGRVNWKGRLRGGGSDVLISGTWVHENFKT